MSKASKRRRARANKQKPQVEAKPADDLEDEDQGGQAPPETGTENAQTEDSPPSPPGETGGSEPPSSPEPQGGGLINQGTGPQSFEDPVLQRAEAKVESQLLPEVRADYMKVVVAGMKLAMAKNGQLVAALQHSHDPVKDCAIGSIHVGLILFKESRNTMPVKALVPAAMTMMLKALDFCDKSGIKKITNVELDEATKIFMNYMLHTFKVTPQKLQKLAGNVHSVLSDPGQVDILNRRVGLVRDPRAEVGTSRTQQPPPFMPKGT